ncbi:3-oxoacyl-[acyl-carrier-protein] synthase I, chloroplastic-like protein, partial [Tanacetum coccineum]
MGSALLAIDTGLIGPNYSISIVCATANYCFFNATNHVRRGDVDIMVPNETEATVNAIGVGGFNAYRALSKPPLHMPPLRVLEPQKVGLALIPIDANLSHTRLILVKTAWCSSCTTKYLEDLDISPEEANNINCHATSTLAGDLAQVNAIKKVFKDTLEIRINGTKKMNETKSIIGHGLGAASGLEAIA